MTKIPLMNPETSGIVKRALPAILSLVVLASASQGAELSPVPESPRYEITLEDIEGRERSLDEFRDEVVLVTFWASWCIPCLREIPSLLRLQEAMQDQPFAVVAVNVAEGKRRVQAAARRLGLDFPVLLDRDSRVFDAWGAEVLPTAFVLDRDGRARYVAQGPREWDRIDIQNTLKGLISEAVGNPGAVREPREPVR